MSNAMTPYMYLGIEIKRLRVKITYLNGFSYNTDTEIQARLLGEELAALEKMQNAIPEHKRK